MLSEQGKKEKICKKKKSKIALARLGRK